MVDEDMPKVVKRPFLKGGFVDNIFRKEARERLKEPVLLLLREDGFIDVVENVKTGIFKINANTEKEKAIDLIPEKLQKLRYNGEFYTAWMAYENEFIPYPTNVKHDSKSIYGLLKTAVINKDKLSGGAGTLFGMNAKSLFILMIGIAIVLYFVFGTNMLSGITGSVKNTVAPAVTSAVKTVASNGTAL